MHPHKMSSYEPWRHIPVWAGSLFLRGAWMRHSLSSRYHCNASCDITTLSHHDQWFADCSCLDRMLFCSAKLIWVVSTRCCITRLPSSHGAWEKRWSLWPLRVCIGRRSMAYLAVQVVVPFDTRNCTVHPIDSLMQVDVPAL